MRDVFCGSPATLQQILDSRSRRACLQREWLKKGGCVVSFSLNIPGAVKQFPLARRAFLEGWQELQALFAPGDILQKSCSHSLTGSEGLLRLSLSPAAVKEHTVALEMCHPLGRLFDIDVLGPEGIPLSRTALGGHPRLCLVCGQNAKICARSRAHEPQLLRQAVSKLLLEYFGPLCARQCGTLACRALLYEVAVTPKPGLVDRSNSGSHRDMDFFTFIDSSTALEPWFGRMFRLGWEGSDLPAKELFPRLRQAGRQAEQAMLSATAGVNTHKGMVFSLGILCAALGRRMALADAPLSPGALRQACRELGEVSLEDFSRCPENTAGMQHYRQGLGSGARGQAAQGFPLLWEVGLPTLHRWLSRGAALNDAAAATLLALIACADDTNMFHRGGAKLAADSRCQAQKALEALTDENCLSVLAFLDKDYMDKNLSPGGCADLLALTLMVYLLQKEGWLEASCSPLPL